MQSGPGLRDKAEPLVSGQMDCPPGEPVCGIYMALLITECSEETFDFNREEIQIHDSRREYIKTFREG